MSSHKSCDLAMVVGLGQAGFSAPPPEIHLFFSCDTPVLPDPGTRLIKGGMGERCQVICRNDCLNLYGKNFLAVDRASQYGFSLFSVRAEVPAAREVLLGQLRWF